MWGGQEVKICYLNFLEFSQLTRYKVAGNVCSP